MRCMSSTTDDCRSSSIYCLFFFFQAEDGIRDYKVTGVQTCALPIYFTGPWLNEANLTYEHFTQEPTPNTPGIPQRWFYIQTPANVCCATIGSNLSKIGRASCRERV